MSSPQTTSLKDLLGTDHPNVSGNQPTQIVDQTMDPSAQFAQMPSGGGGMIQQRVQPIIHQQPVGPGQGVSTPDIKGKDFFTNLKEFDYRTIILVFSIILILSSGIFYSVLRPYVPGAIGIDGKVTLVGSLVAAIVGTIIFILVKIVGKF